MTAISRTLDRLAKEAGRGEPLLFADASLIGLLSQPPAFDLARTACMSCHVAEKVGYFNDQSLFVDLTPPATSR